jgi:hypothetical protein
VYQQKVGVSLVCLYRRRKRFFFKKKKKEKKEKEKEKSKVVLLINAAVSYAPAGYSTPRS